MNILPSFVLIFVYQNDLVHSSPQVGGQCTSSADCVAPNVCSKWGWCQWTKIYGEEGPSQGSSAPDGGRAGQCKTSADCGSRVPYCSQLGFCHGGTLPFFEEQLDIKTEVKQTEPKDQPQGFLNNDPRKNSPVFKNQKNEQTKAASNRGTTTNTGSGGAPKNAGSGGAPKNSGSGGAPKNSGNSGASQNAASGSECKGGSLEKCIESCPTQGYASCVSACGKKC